MADRNVGAAVGFLVLVVMMPQMVTSIKFPRFNLSPRTQKQLRDFFNDHKSDIVGLFPSDGFYYDRSQPSNGGGRSQAAATSAPGGYVLSFGVGGTNPQAASGVLHLHSDLVWMQCSCPECMTQQGQEQMQGTIFYPRQSSTMLPVPCHSSECESYVPEQTCNADAITGNELCFYTYTYSGIASTTGYLANDTFTFGSDPVSNVTFGCGFYNTGDFGGAYGVIGLGRGPLSLVSQLGDGRFSYYFASDNIGDSESFLQFGDDAMPKTSRVSMPTRLLASTSDGHRSFYYVGLTGIQVDGEDLPIPTGTFDLDGSAGGVTLSITVPVTFLNEGAYYPLRRALVSKLQLQGLTPVSGSELGLDLCYSSQSLAMAKVPAMALVFDGGVVMELQTRNYFYLDAVNGLECLTILRSPSRASVLGNLIQTGTHMIYDVPANKLQFESFDSPPPLWDSSTKALPMSFSVLLYMIYWIIITPY